MQQIEDFASIKPPVQLWRCNGHFSDLFYFLANRFLGAPDHVLDTESVHAQWKWIEVKRDGIKFKLLNALVKLRFYRFTNHRLPPSEQLRHQVEEIQRGHIARYNALVAGGDRHPAMLRDAPYLSRFNLRATDAVLIRDVDRAAAGKPNGSKKSPDITLSSYIRCLFKPRHMYSFSNLDTRNSKKYLLVTENKSVAYRADSKPDQTFGRHMSVVWYEEALEVDPDEELSASEIFLLPCGGDLPTLPVQEMTIGEISLAAGYYPTVLPNQTERDIEILHEQAVLNNNVEHFESRRCHGPGWARIVKSDTRADIEWWFFEQTDLNEMTRFAFARMLQVRDGLTDAQRTRVWSLTWDVLHGAFINTPAALATVAAAVGIAPPIAPAVAAKANAKAKAKAVVAKAKPGAAAAKAGGVALVGRGVGRGRGAGRGRGRRG